MKEKAVKSRCVVFGPDFRLPPEYQCPKPSSDIYDCIKYVYENAEFFGIDENKILLCGRSGGALLACSAALHLSRASEQYMIKALFLEAPILTEIMLSAAENDLTVEERQVMGKDRNTWRSIFQMLAIDYEDQIEDQDPFL